MSQSALLVVVPEAESWVGDLRYRHDPVARLGVPAHITLLFPFLSPEAIGDRERSTLAALFGSARAFTFSLMRTGRFPQTVYLEPDPAEPFVELTGTLADAFPSCPPYGGQFSEVLPHLTVSDKDPDAVAEVASEIQARIAARGPIHATCSEVQLYEDSSGYWRHMETFGLAQ